MPNSYKLKPSDSCPCYSGKKFRNCCERRVDWQSIIRHNMPFKHLLSARGRNILFSEAIGDALQLDRIDGPLDLAEYKKSFTASAVKKIYEAVVDLWPTNTDISSILGRNRGDVAGLYIGDYEAKFLEQAVLRHSLYADKILAVEPFSHPYVRSDEYNPILNPAPFRAQTLRDVNRFFRFLPWIDAGIVEFIRTPADFDRKLAWASMERATKSKQDPEVRKLLEEGSKQLDARHREPMARHMLLMNSPDSYLRKLYSQRPLDDVSADEFIEHVQSLRDSDEDFLETIDQSGENGQLHIMTSGAEYSVAKITAEMSGAYLFTDLKMRWEQIRQDRRRDAASEVWSPMAKALQDVQLRFLNNVSFSDALRLREDGLLRGLRSTLLDAVRSDVQSQAYSEAAAVQLGQRIEDAVHDADAEWKSVNADILRLGALDAGLAGAAIVVGQVNWLTAAIAGGGAAALAAYKSARERAFKAKHPAAFFMSLEESD